MKKFFPILLAIVVLLSSLNLTFSTHFCGKKVTSVVAGLNGTVASCGMNKDNRNCSNHSGFSSAGCCKNTLLQLSLGNYNITQVLDIKKVNLTVLQIFFIPIHHALHVQSLKSISPTGEGPFHLLFSLSGRLAFICVFRK